MGRSISEAVGWTAAGERVDYKIYKDPVGDAEPGFKVNKNKIVHLCFYKYKDKNKNIINTPIENVIDSLDGSTDENYWDNWRDGKSLIAGEDIGGLKVPNSVYPVMDNLNIQGGFNIGSITATEIMNKGAGTIIEKINEIAKNAAKFGEAANFGLNAMDTVKNGVMGSKSIGEAIDGANNALLNMPSTGAANALNKGIITSKFDSFPVANMDGLQAKAPEQVSFTFNIGCANYFDGELEVVRPIAAIENKIIPVFATGAGTDSDPNTILAPMASPAQFSAAVWGATATTLAGVFGTVANVASAGVDTITSAFSGGDTRAAAQNLGAELLDMGYRVQRNVIRAKDAAVAAIAPYTVLLFIRCGNATLGPFSIESCSHIFDYSQVDEKGYPYKGTLTLGIKTVFKPNRDDNLVQMGYRIK